MAKQKKNGMQKNLRRTIRGSLGRFVAIVLIIALGAFLFVGLLTTKTDMVATCQWYTDKQNLFDLRLLNTYGWTDADVQAVAAMDGVAQAEGNIGIDVLMRRSEEEDSMVFHVLSIPERINCVELQGGRMPQSPDECLADGFVADDSILGQQYIVSESNDPDTIDALTSQVYTVVGYVSSPLYLNMERGNTSLGNGKVQTFLYIPAEGFQLDYYTDIYVTLPGDYAVYTDAYDDAMDALADALEPQLEPLAQARLEQVRSDAEQAYADGMAEYEDGLAEYEQGKKDAEQELADAKKALEDGQKEVDENRKTLEDGRAQLEEAQNVLDESAATLLESRQTLAKTKSDTLNQLADAQAELLENYKTVKSSLNQVNSGLEQIEDGLEQLDDGISQLEDGLEQIDSGISQLDTLISLMDTLLETAQSMLDNLGESDSETLAELQAKIDEYTQKRDEYAAQREELITSRETYSAQLEELKAQREQLQAQKDELEKTQQTLNEAMDEIETGFTELQSSQTQAENRFAAAEAELEAAQLELDNGQTELNKKLEELTAGEEALAQAQAEIDQGWEDYFEGRQTVEQELADAKAKLDEAKQELADARHTIDTLSEPSVYAMTRNTNLGYVVFESDTDIVAGVARVFPAFFLLVAALVCITTMTRMVNEERTQIGTFKALGYSSGAIIGKYVAYSGIATLAGCILGVLTGSLILPQIIWQAYSIMYNISRWVQVQIDWLLCLAVIVIYAAVMLLVTWYSGRRELREVPAELIRPKAPTSGRKILLEKLPFWEKISFLNKVAIRNIFRYRQRLLMMLLGIGGCTALLVTGFGIRDSIVNIADYQFEEVMVYDIAVTFQDNQTEDTQTEFRQELQGKIDRVLFCHESSVELDTGSGVKEVYLIAGDEDLTDFIDLHDGSAALPVPADGEALVSIGAADALDIEEGDRILVRNADMQTMELTVSGIFDNNVYNYVLINAHTLKLAWPDYGEQTALVTVLDHQDVHLASAQMLTMDGVLNVSVNEDLANQVGTMMDAMDLIVVTIVFCAALLAVVVLYNLTNININERVREIATIKVLGFNSGESAAYVFKENLSLSVMGALLGLLGGKFLLDFVISQVKIDMVWFTPRLTASSFLLAIAITLLAACAVDFLFYFRLERINMAEALKSVE